MVQEMFVYVAPVIAFLIVSLSMYFISGNKEKNKTSNIFIRNILPAFAVSMVVFVIMKYRDNLFNSEPMMAGYYFENN